MEEDIKILEEVKRPTLATGFERQTKILKALRNLINKYKEYEECLEVTSLALNNIAYDQIPIAIGEQEEEIEKKDKIIDLMAEKLKQLREASLDDCFIPRSYRDIDDCLRTTCEECIKEYFENKVKESK